MNYFLGFVPNGVPKVEGYSRIVYKNVYSNVDMQVYSNNVGTKLYFVCNPASGTGISAGNPANIELKFKGATSVTINSDSGVSIVTELGTLSFAPGYAYTDSAGIIKPKSWHANLEVVSSNTVRFHTGTYNTNEPLIIQVDRGHRGAPTNTPNLHWSTYYGGNWLDHFFNVSTDKKGNIYATGLSESGNFPVTLGAFQANLRGAWNTVIVKFHKNNDSLLWSTYYGGSNSDQGNCILADVKGNVYVTGSTSDFNFPLFNPGNGAYFQPSPNGVFGSAFIVKLDSTGAHQKWATYYGGDSGVAIANYMALDGLGNLYVVGQGVEPDVKTTFPLYVEPGAFNDSTYGTGFILKFDSSGVRKWATRIGGNNSGKASTSALFGCAVDASNNFFVTGQVSESGYPILNAGGNSTYYGGGSSNLDAVATKFNASNNAINWSTYYSGSGDEWGNAIATDPSGNAYITGPTSSPWSGPHMIPLNNPGFPAFYDGSNPTTGFGGNNYCTFIAEFAPTGPLQWGTCFGDSNNIFSEAMTFDSKQDLYICGYTQGPGGLNFPSPNVTGTYVQNVFGSPGNDGFIAAFDKNLTYVWGTYFGGSQNDNGRSVATYGDILYMDGTTTSRNLPLSNPGGGAWFQGTYTALNGTAFIAGLNLAPVILAGINNAYKTVDTEKILIYPNPTSQDVTVQMQIKESGTVKFVLYSLMGESVYSYDYKEQAGTIEKQIPVSLLPGGTYILKVVAGDKVFHGKIIKLQ